MNQQHVPCSPPQSRWLHITGAEGSSYADNFPGWRHVPCHTLDQGGTHCGCGGDIFTDKGTVFLLLSFTICSKTLKRKILRAHRIGKYQRNQVVQLLACSMNLFIFLMWVTELMLEWFQIWMVTPPWSNFESWKNSLLTYVNWKSSPSNSPLFGLVFHNTEPNNNNWSLAISQTLC